MTRVERVEALIREEISDILRDKVSDPRVGFVTITRVEVSPDFKNASIFVSVFADENKKKEAMQGLYSATGFIQHELGQMLELRVTPRIRFVQDDSLERGSRVLGIMDKLHDEKNTGKYKKRHSKV
jgi:ribosome-binding factor A